MNTDGRRYKSATAFLPRRYGETIKSGMSDEDLSNALQSVLGIFGGSGGLGRPSISFAGSGLRIWGRIAGLPLGKFDDPVDHQKANERRDGAKHLGPGKHIVNHVSENPIFAGKAAIAMARTVYKIKDPKDDQLALFQ